MALRELRECLESFGAMLATADAFNGGPEGNPQIAATVARPGDVASRERQIIVSSGESHEAGMGRE
jgi:hypothetical protein